MSEEFYDTVHSSYFPLKESRHEVLESDRFNKCLTLMRQCKPRDFLELGFGDPVLSQTIASTLEVQYTGIDVSEFPVKQAVEMGLNALQLDISVQKLPFPDESFDFIYCSEVVEHLYNPDFAVEEFKRVLRRDGRILVTTPNLAAWYNRILLLAGIQPIHSEVSTLKILGRRSSMLGQGNPPVGHIRLFTLGGLLDFIRLHNLTLVYLQGYKLEIVKHFKVVESLFSRVPPLASGFIVLLRKKADGR